MSMLMLAVILSILYLSIKIIKVIIHNYRAQKFFQRRSPSLPIVRNANIFVGTVDQTISNAKNWQLIDKLHKRIGKSFGHYVVDQPWVNTTDIDLLKKVFLDEGNKHPDRICMEVPIHEFKTSIAQINGDAWQRVRKALAPSMTNIRVRSEAVSPDIEKMIARFIASLERKLDKAERSTKRRSVILDVHDQVQRLTSSVIVFILYKRDIEIDFDADEDSWMKEAAEGEVAIDNPILRLTWALPFLYPIAVWLNQFTTFGRINARLAKYVDECLKQRQNALKKQVMQDHKLNNNQTGVDHKTGLKSEPIKKRGIMDVFIDKFLDKEINYEQYIGTGHFLVLAGFETTAITTTGLLWQLAQNQDIQTKLRETIITEGIDADYVVWCLMEAVRWHNPVPLGTGRIITEDITTGDGLIIPKGTYVSPSIYSIHRDESIWPEANKFMPERWRYQSKFHPAAFMGFGLGQRNCPGTKLAIHEIKLIMAAILTRYKFEKCEDTINAFTFLSPGMMYAIPEERIKLRFTPLDQCQVK